VSTANLTIALTFGLYLLTMLGLGLYAYRRTRDLSDFVLGGRSLGSWVTALSAGASDMSGWLLLGLPGFAYAAGLQSLWLAVGLLLGTWLNWRLMAARLRVYSETAGNALTLPEFFARRFRDDSGLLRVISAVFILLFFLFYTSSGLVAGGKLFESVFGLPYTWAVAAGVVAIILYTTVGGFLAVSWTALVQGLLMAAALLAVPLMAIDSQSTLAASLTAANPTSSPASRRCALSATCPPPGASPSPGYFSPSPAPPSPAWRASACWTPPSPATTPKRSSSNWWTCCSTR
jgi:sodium/proline symporter